MAARRPADETIGLHVRRHASVVVAATRALVRIHQGTLSGLREVEVLFGGPSPRAITSSIRRESESLKVAQRAIVELQAIVGGEGALDRLPRLADRPTVEGLVRASRGRAPTAHLMAIRRWNLQERRRLWEVTSGPAGVLATMLRQADDDDLAEVVEGLWSQAASRW